MTRRGMRAGFRGGAVALAAVMLLGCSHGQSQPTGSVRGQVVFVGGMYSGPASPKAGTLVGLRQGGGKTVASVRTDRAGNFSFRVSPGIYTVGTWCTNSQYAVTV